MSKELANSKEIYILKIKPNATKKVIRAGQASNFHTEISDIKSSYICSIELFNLKKI